MGKKIIVAGLFSVIFSPAFAQDWKPLNAEGIVAALSERALVYEDGARQTFRESGRTTYSVGAGDSQGSWRVEGDQYCSNWPPATTWSCYAFEWDAESGRLRFVSASGDVTVGTYVKE
jgi:hypothetical protein